MAKEKAKTTKNPKPAAAKAKDNFFVKYAYVILPLSVIILYFRTFLFSSLTQLDDTIFIFDKMEFNSHFKNIIQAFNVGCFNEKDIYYRPIFLISFILEHPFFSRSYIIYHLTDIALHTANVLLLFTFLKRINIAKHIAFVLALIYAVHPVLTMAVAWIPGRNDLILALFTYSFFLSVIKYSEEPNPLHFALQFVFYLLCLFTKETAVFIPFVTVLLFLCWKKDNLLQNKYYLLAGGWFLSLALWYYKRSTALESSNSGAPIWGIIFNPKGRWHELLQPFVKAFLLVVERIPGLLQYLGKIFLPFNLNVFPTIKETTFIYGAISLVGLIVIIVLNKQRNNRMVLLGAGWFIFFILPFFFVPKNINDQLFEHRLYLPIVGVFIMLSQSILFTKKISEKIVIGVGVALSCVLAVGTFIYMNQFDNELAFWLNASKHSPSSAYANKMYGIKLAEAGQKEKAIPYFKLAYSIDTLEPFTNLFLSRLVYEPADSIEKAEHALKAELRLNPGFPDTYLELSHIYFLKHDLENSKTTMLKYLTIRPDNKDANNNLMLLYIDLKEFKEAKEQIDNMERMDISVDAGTKALVNNALSK